jgi:hypothetical protein
MTTGRINQISIVQDNRKILRFCGLREEKKKSGFEKINFQAQIFFNLSKGFLGVFPRRVPWGFSAP